MKPIRQLNTKRSHKITPNTSKRRKLSQELAAARKHHTAPPSLPLTFDVKTHNGREHQR